MSQNNFVALLFISIFILIFGWLTLDIIYPLLLVISFYDAIMVFVKYYSTYFIAKPFNN